MRLGISIAESSRRQPAPFWTAPAYRAESAGGGAYGPAAILDLRRDRHALTTVPTADIPSASLAALTALAARPLTDILAFTRSGTATYIDADGLIRVAAADQPRFDYTHGKRQLLLEGPATNLCITRNLPQLTLGENTIVTHMPDETGPDGVRGNVYRVQMPAAPSTFVRFANSVGGGGPVVMSVFVRQFDAAKRQFSIAVDGKVDSVLEATEEWLRYESAYSPSYGTAALGNNAPLGASDVYASDILVAFPQVELGLVATSYIPTNGTSVTRPADKAQLSPAVAALLKRDQVSVMVQARLASAADNGRILGLDMANWLIGQAGASGAGFSAWNGSSATTRLLPAGVTSLDDFGVAVNLDEAGTALAAGEVISGTNASATKSSYAPFSDAYLGRSSTGAYSNGWYDQIVIWPFRMTDADLQAKAVAYE